MKRINLRQLSLTVGSFIFLSALSSCIFFVKTQKVSLEKENLSSAQIQSIINSKAIDRNEIYIVKGGSVFRLDDADLSTGKIMGYLSPVSELLYPEPKLGRRGALNPQLRKEGTYKDVLYLEVKDMIEPGEIALEFGQITDYYIIKDQPGPTILLGLVESFALFVGFLAIACNCPRVYVNQNETPIFQGSMLSGAISKSLEREDVLPLTGLTPQEAPLSISIANELPEDQYLNSFSLQKASYPTGMQIAKMSHGPLFAYKELKRPEAAIQTFGKDVKAALHDVDEQVHRFEEKNDGERLNSITLKFNKEEFDKDEAKLIIYGRQTEWLEEVAEVFFMHLGKKFDAWNKKMDKVDPATYAENTAKRGISLKASVQIDGKWQPVGAFHDAGVISSQFLGIDLDLSQIPSNDVVIKLESAFGFWEIDQVGMTTSWEAIDAWEEVPMLEATNSKGENVMDLIAKQDKSYAEQPHKSDALQLSFDTPIEKGYLYALTATGYYHHVRDYDHKAEWKTLARMKRRGDIVTHEMSMEWREMKASLAQQK
ncbi:MAG: hypothetical protein AAFY71_12495 [Bacteroidota bacterium]